MTQKISPIANAMERFNLGSLSVASSSSRRKRRQNITLKLNMPLRNFMLTVTMSVEGRIFSLIIIREKCICINYFLFQKKRIELIFVCSIPGTKFEPSELFVHNSFFIYKIVGLQLKYVNSK